MQTCFFCGKTIEIRFHDDGLVPFHSHGVPCSYERVRDLKASQEFCHATRCPHCRGEVFFVRHNGGSVWLEDPGFPWLKHGCTHDKGRSVERQLAFDLAADMNPSYSLGCVLDVMEGRDRSELIISGHDYRVARIVVSGRGNLTALKGQLVFFSEREMICRYHVTIDDLLGQDSRVFSREIREIAWL